MIPFANLKQPKEIYKEVKKVLDSGQYISGKQVEELEKEFAEYCKVKYAIGVNSGTSALTVALLALGIGEGDEVITQPNTFVATIEAILFTGAKPVFVDINPKTYNLDFLKIEKAITKKTKAILPVHLFGQVADMTPILKIAKKYDLFVIEDACQAQGAEYKGKKAGSMGDIGCFSFYPTKVLGACGEGGAITTNSRKLAEKIRRLRNHGSDKKYHHSEIGFNFRMEEIQGAILKIKLKYLDHRIRIRQDKADFYSRLLTNDFNGGVYYVYVIRVRNRDKLQKHLLKYGIETMVHYPIPIHLQGGYKFLGYRRGDFPEAEKASKEILSLPLYPELKPTEQEYICAKLNEFL